MGRNRRQQQNKAQYVKIPRQTLRKGIQFPCLLQATIRPIELVDDFVFSPYRIQRRAPGHYYFKNGCMWVPPPEPMGRFLGITIKNNEKQMQFFSGKDGILRPTKKQSTTGRKERTTYVTIELDKPQLIDYIFNPYDGSPIQIMADNRLLLPLKTIIENFYERGVKRKIINKFIYSHDHVYYDANVALKRYDQLYVVDTNTFWHKDRAHISVTVARQAVVTSIEQSEILFELGRCLAFLTLDPEGTPEIEAWKVFIEHLLNATSDIVGRKIGIIVDSELDCLESFNLRQTNLPPEYPLPEGFEFIYASDSSGRDQFAVNKLLAACDRQSAEYIRTLKATPLAQLTSI